MQPKKLEQYKYFGPIAWVVLIVFVLFVFSLVLRLKDAIYDLETRFPSTESSDVLSKEAALDE